MSSVFMIERVVGSPSTVLISGECGTGKELVARALHRESEVTRPSYDSIVQRFQRHSLKLNFLVMSVVPSLVLQ